MYKIKNHLKHKNFLHFINSEVILETKCILHLVLVHYIVDGLSYVVCKATYEIYTFKALALLL